MDRVQIIPVEVGAVKLYDFPHSRNAYKVRLMCSMLDLDYERKQVDLLEGEQREEWFLALNPRGQVPVLADGETVLWDSQAILVYLAEQYDPEDQWYPNRPADRGRVQQWLAFSADELHDGVQTAVAIVTRDVPGDLERAQQKARDGMMILQQRLEDADWLAATHPTVADVICYPWVSGAPRGEIDLEPYPAVRDWIGRFEDLPGYEELTASA